jgi:hypothetical protein
MRQELEDKLVSTFPQYFANATPSVGSGWFKILWDMCNELQAVSAPSFSFMQIKEKWGFLNVYVCSGTDQTHDIIRRAEVRSETTCERCGLPGKKRGGGWISVLCDSCQELHATGGNFWGV